ncbi:Predicted arabinose efflux permease, MFS family [Robiginitalea myxolifaciens]|uniref:Predicted arabinose efflux permease, MFS family n=1 Tax=Robiginitalea myxolifaciens TaxID=400055 RepID=A0A1I6FW50_9FLAO|nr:MFS transporter [Robiginitalea myxolifaciens]SFR34047.1 Predicted arabinose efflux permease, MFS family [Robiginitalea myxolifaciens]
MRNNLLSGLFKSRIFPILLVNFIGILGYSIVVPILIFIVQDFGGNGFIYGVLGATYPFFQFIGAPILGRLSDRVGRKKVLIVSQVGTFIAWSLFLLAFLLPENMLWSQDNQSTGRYVMTLPLAVIFIARMFDGFTGGNVSVANAYMSDISDDENRSSNFGKMGASTSLGFVLGPALAGILASTVLGATLPLILAALISLIAIFVIVFRLQESVPCVVDTKNVSLRNIRRFFQVEHKDCFTEGELKAQGEEQKSWKAVLKLPGIPLLYAIYFLTFFAFSLFYAGLPIYASDYLDWTASALGIFLAYSSLIMVLVQGPVLSRLSKIISSHALVLIGSFCLGISFMALSTENILQLYAANTLLSIGNGLMWPSFLSILSGIGTKSFQGAIQGYGTSMGSIASMLGLLVGGTLFVGIGSLVFTVGGVVFLIITLLMTIHRFGTRKKRMQAERERWPVPRA